jgi:class 3 adenylate cyclase/SAM-dependent methyltransferase
MVTILFCDLSDSTGIAAALEPEQFAELLDQIRVIAHRIIPAHGGDMIRLDGDGMLCVFGYPEPHEDAGRRATEAALDMQAAISALDLGFASPDRRLQLHSGVHAGMVLLQPGDLVRGKYEVLGDATNAAARIRDAAGPGEILVSAQSLGGERHLFLTGAQRDVAVRGHPNPLACLPVLGRAAARRRFDARTLAGLTPFQGRDAQCGAFAQWLADAGNEKSVFFVHGPAGIGKSRLLQMMTRQAQAAGWPVVQGYCEAYLGARPLQPFHQAVAMLPAPASTDDLEGALAAAGRLLLVIDDWQWADDASRDLLGRLLRRADAANLRCVLASREIFEEIPGTAPISDIALPPLDRDAALGVIESLLRSPDPFDVGRIEQAAGGSPLLIEELCLAFGAGLGTQMQDARGGWFDLAVQARFDRLTQQDRQLLKLTAVIGHMVPIWLIETLQGQPLDDQQLGRLQQADFLFRGETGDTYRFKHGLTRESLYAAIGLKERKALHADVLAALEAGVSEHPPRALLDGLAYHAIASGDAAKGLPYAIAAGDAALAAGALDRAQGHYLAALDIVSRLPAGRARRDAAWTLINKYGLACIIDPAPDQLPVLEKAQAILAEHGGIRERNRPLRSADPRPNILFVFTDQQTASALSCAGNPWVRTPFADALARSGRARDAAPMLREAWRVLAPGGRLIAVVPNRVGLWARLETTPFGYGRPYTRSQLSGLLKEALFSPIDWRGAFFFTPWKKRFLIRTAPMFERAGAAHTPGLSGGILVEATKQLYQGLPTRARASRSVPVFRPVPAFAPRETNPLLIDPTEPQT